MPTIEEALYSALANWGPVATLAGDRIYPMAIPQTAALPAVAYQRVGGPRLDSHGGDLGAAEATIQITIVAETYSMAKALVTAIRDLFPYRGELGGLVNVWQGTIDNEVDGWGPAIEAPTIRLDLRFLYSEP